MTPPPTLVLSWQEFDTTVRALAQRAESWLRHRAAPILVAQPRGGLALTLALAHQLQVSAERVYLARRPAPDGYDTVIWVDDVFDSGATLAKAQAALGANALYVAWVNKQPGELPANCYAVRRAPADRWVVFPWERRDQRAIVRDVAAYQQRTR